MNHSEGARRVAVLSVFITVFLVFTLVFSQAALVVSATTENVQTSAIAKAGEFAGYGTEDASTAEFYIEKAEKANRFFTGNEGQFGSDVRFVADTEFGKAVFYDSRILYVLERHEDGRLSCADSVTMTFPGCNLVSPAGEGLKSHRSNYLFGEESNWITDVRSYDSIAYTDIWTGIDLVYTFSAQGLKYEFIVSPFVSVDVVRVSVQGASLSEDASTLVLDTGRGCLTDGDLMAGYGVSDERLSARFVVEMNEYGFDIPERDISRAVVIDPLVSST
ncbi:MAG: hypothetical protein LUQ27_00340, partial [Methanomassiliicoccales archaeon]|nr:hypothetical protein [Methanomassiliicoccales archaeon]